MKTHSSCTFASSLLLPKRPHLLLPSAQGKGAQSGHFKGMLPPPASAICCPRAGVTCVVVFAFLQGFCTVTVLLWSAKGALSHLQRCGCNKHRFNSPCEIITEGQILPFQRTESKHFGLSRPASICFRSARSKGIQELQEKPQWDSHTPFAIPSPSCKV